MKGKCNFKRAISVVLTIAMLISFIPSSYAATSISMNVSPTSGGWFCPNKTLTVSWNSISGASYYIYSVAYMMKTNDGSGNELNGAYQNKGVYNSLQRKKVSGRTITFQPGTFDYSGAYKIWVCGVDSSGNDISSSAGIEYVFSNGENDYFPTISEPSNGSTNTNPESLKIAWKSVSGATRYFLSIRNLDTNNLYYDKEPMGTSTYAYVDLEYGTNYKIAVGADLPKGEKWREITIKTKAASLGAFNITSPSNGASFDFGSDVTVSWGKSANAVEYQLYMRDLSVSNSSSKIIYTGSTNKYVIKSDELTGGHQYKIHVKARAKSGSDEIVKWASNSDEDLVYSFNYGELSAPKITSPANGGELYVNYPVIEWDGVDNAGGYALKLVDNTSGKNIFNFNSYDKYIMGSEKNNCILSEITWGNFSMNDMVAGHSYTATIYATGPNAYEKKGNSVTFTLKENSVPSVTNYGVSSVKATSFVAGGKITTTATMPLSSITEYGFYYKKEGSSTPEKVSLGVPSENIFYYTITDLEPETTYEMAAYAKNSSGEGVSPWISVTTEKEDEIPKTYVLEVTPISGKAKNVYTFSMDTDTLPENAYLQFDNAETGEWFNEAYSASAWAFNWQDYVIKSDGFILTKELNISTPGKADNNYKRKARVIYYCDGVERITDPIEFTVKPNDEEIPAITIDDVSYSINGKNLTVTVLTSSAVEKLKLKNNQTTMDVFDSEYETQTSGKKLWKITKPVSYYANKKMTFIPGSNEYGYSDSSYELFISYDAPSSMGTLEIESPQLNAPHQKNRTLSVSWSAPVTKPDSYTLTLSHNDDVVYTENIGANATTATIPGEYFAYSGIYSISLTASKSGYKNLNDNTEVYIEYDDTPIIPGDDLGTAEYGKNPTHRQVYNYICNYVAGWDTTTSSPDYLHALFAMVWQESKWEQFEKNSDGKIVPIIRKNKNGTYDVGITQVNSDSSKFAESEEKLKNNWQFNLEFGIGRFNERYWACMTEPLYIAAVEEGMRKTGVSREEAIARSAYAMYNGGKNLESAKRWYTLRKGTTENDPVDVKYYAQDNGYYNKYDQKPWEKETGIYIDEEKSTQISKPGVIKIAMDVPVEVRTSSDSSSNIIGRLGNGTNVTVISSKNSYLKVEGRDFETGKTITGYVKAAYVSYDIAPVRKDTSFIGTVNKTSINIGDEVTFTVNATYGSYDFRISFDGSYEESVEMNYFDGVYNYARPINGVGSRNASMSWYEPSLKSRVSVDFPTIEIWIPGNGWKSSFNGNQLSIEQEYIIGDERIEHGNDDIQYGLYIKNSKGAYSYGEYGIDKYTHINEPGTWALHRTWNVSSYLFLAPGTYEYGIVAIHNNNRRECKLSTFTLEQYNAETYTQYIGAEGGAIVYDTVTDDKVSANQYIKLEKGQKVERIYGTESGPYNGYAQVKFPWTDGDGNTYTYTKWISKEALTESNPHGLDNLYQKDGKTKYEPSVDYKNSQYYKNVMGVELTGNHRTDIVNVALSQYNYFEGGKSSKNLSGKDEKEYNNYTEYGRWWGGQGQAWCAFFVSWCARQAEIPMSVLENGTNGYPCKDGTLINEKPKNGFNITEKGKNSGYVPLPGDLFFNNGHVGIVVAVSEDGKKFKTIEGNTISGGTRVGSHDYFVSEYTFGVPNYNNGGIPLYEFLPSYSEAEPGRISVNAIRLMSLEEETIDTISYYLSCYDTKNENFKTLRGTNNGTISLEVPEKTGSVNVRIPIDESSQLVTLYHAGQGYENGSNFNFTTNTISFTAIVKDLIGEGEYEFDFEIHRKAPEETAVNYATVSYYNAEDEYIGGEIVDFDNPEIGKAPYTTSYIKFDNVDNEKLTIEVSTGSYYEEKVWLPISYKFNYNNGEQQFVLSVNNGTSVHTVEYTIVRQEKSSDTSIQNISVGAYDESKELFASNIYAVEDDVISIGLPYSTKYFGINVEKFSVFSTTEIYVNNTAVAIEELIDVSNVKNSFITVVAEDGTTKKYELQINVAQTQDKTAPVITVVGESGTTYTSGSKITEMVTYFANDESWCETSLYFDGELLDEMEGISECGNYTVIATDVFGNKSEFSFVYDDGTLPLTNTTFKNTATYHKFYVTFEKPMDNATIYAAIYNKDGKMLGLQTSPCDGDDYYIINVPVNSDTKKATIFVWADKIKPLGYAETLNME